MRFSLPNRRQPCGPPEAMRELPWRDGSYCVIDFETTGLDLRKDEIISFGAAFIDHGRIDTQTCQYSLARPDCAVSAESTGVHALRDIDLRDAPPQQKVAEALADVLDGRVLIAHAAWVEQALLDRLLRRVNRRLIGGVIDTASLARVAGLAPATGGREPSLEGLAVKLGLPVHTPHHALGDAMTTAVVFLSLASRLTRQPTPGTVAWLQRLSRDNSFQ